MRLRTAALTIVAAASLAAACSSDSEPAAEPAAAATPAPAAEPAPEAEPESSAAISIEGFAFSALDPVAPGTQIEVTNLDGDLHTLTADDGSFNTGGLDGGASATITAPDAPGTYTFICNIHPSMTGSLTVSG